MVAKSDRIAQLQNILVASEGRSSEAVQVLQAEAEAVREQHEVEARQWEREMKALRDEAAELRAFKAQKAQLESELLALKAEVNCAQCINLAVRRGSNRAGARSAEVAGYGCGPATGCNGRRERAAPASLRGGPVLCPTLLGVRP